MKAPYFSLTFGNDSLSSHHSTQRMPTLKEHYSDNLKSRLIQIHFLSLVEYKSKQQWGLI